MSDLSQFREDLLKPMGSTIFSASLACFDMAPQFHCVRNSLPLTRFIVVTGSVALIAIQAGCRQTNGSTASGPLQPFTSPDGSMAAPSLLPLGGGNPFQSGDSRVAPPASGALPNNYMGGTPTANAAMPSTAQLVGSPDGAIGSGVAQSGWQADTIPGMPGTAQVSQTSATFSDGSSVPAADSSRSGGMPVIDLTNAPPPPGYFVTNGYESTQAPTYGQGVPTQSAYQTTSFPGAGDSLPAQNLVPMQPADVRIGNIATSQPPRVRLSQNGPQRQPLTHQMAPSVSRPIEPAPSTRPIDSTHGAGDLPWQNPARF